MNSVLEDTIRAAAKRGEVIRDPQAAIDEIEALRADVHYLCRFNPRFADLMYDAKMRAVREARLAAVAKAMGE
jgi:hypothetical protein